MQLHVIFIFTLILIIITVSFHIIFLTQFQKQKQIKATHEFKNVKMIRFIYLYLFIVLLPINVAVVTMYVMILSIKDLDEVFGYLYLIFGILNYFLTLSYLFYTNLINNSLWIKIDDTTVYFLDEEIPINSIIGIDVNRKIKRLLFKIDDEIDNKKIIGKRLFNYLKDIEI